MAIGKERSKMMFTLYIRICLRKSMDLFLFLESFAPSKMLLWSKTNYIRIEFFIIIAKET